MLSSSICGRGSIIFEVGGEGGRREVPYSDIFILLQVDDVGANAKVIYPTGLLSLQASGSLQMRLSFAQTLSTNNNIAKI